MISYSHLPIHAIRLGFYSDTYFTRAKHILTKDKHHPTITHQVIQKKGRVIICGLNETKTLLKICVGYYKDYSLAKKLFTQFQSLNHPSTAISKLSKKLDQLWVNQYSKIKVKSLKDGQAAKAKEPVMHIIGDYSLFAHLENLYLGILARRTQLATNTHALVKAANDKPVLSFANRSDYFLNQEGDGYAINIGGAKAISTNAMGSWINKSGIGTIPHALIVAYNGNITKAAAKFHQYFPKQNVISLVDFHNDCLKGALDTANQLGKKLWGVRLDTAANQADISTPNHKGVNPLLVKKLRLALDQNSFNHVKIIVSGGFNPEKIALFEKQNTPVDFYAIGSWIMSHDKGKFDFTADAVQLNSKNLAKVGRKYSLNKRLRSW